MNETPRLRSAYPATPQTHRTPVRRVRDGSPGPKFSARATAGPVDSKRAQLAPNDAKTPLIPFDTIDAPSQRLYAAGCYTALFFWRLWDFYNLTVDETESLWLFMKWVAIDGVFLFGLPGLHIPWLEWSPMMTMILFILHAMFDGVLMFRIPIPLGTALVGLSKVLYDREIAVSERHVKPADILHNPNFILGRQIVNILPEGSALLNPDQTPLCLDGSRTSSVLLPLQINQTLPTSMELIRFDLDTNRNESISVSASQMRKLILEAERHQSKRDHGALTLRYSVKKTGLYRLGRVIDKSNLEVQHRLTEALVVSCPTASLRASTPDRCRGDQTDLAIEVEGTPPLKVKYRKSVDGSERDVTFQSIQPDDFVSPLIRQSGSGGLAKFNDLQDLSWARRTRVTVPLSETMNSGNVWRYSIDEVVDATGNTVSYAIADDEVQGSQSQKSRRQEILVVHERPTVSLKNVDFRKPLLVAKDSSISLPIKFGAQGRKNKADEDHDIEYQFTPFHDIASDGDHAMNALTRKLSGPAESLQWNVTEPGLYTLRKVRTRFCTGEVNEPSTMMLVNPPKPELKLTSEPLVDRCAGRAIGLRVELDMTGTPPFEVTYAQKQRGQKQESNRQKFDGPRGHIDFAPGAAGHYTYQFLEISDAVYTKQGLYAQEYSLHQDVKPSVFASFAHGLPKIQACIDQPVEFEVRFQGESPWTLDYELVHGSRRKPFTVNNITKETYTISTEPLTEGGEYSLALVGVTDTQGCREVLQQDAKISIRRQRPKAGFGNIEGKRTVQTLENKKVDLPLRLSGEGPWVVDYRQVDAASGAITSKSFHQANDLLAIHEPGTYELVGVKDSLCPGSVDEAARSFEVTTIARPSFEMSQIDSRTEAKIGGVYQRKEVCEGDEDAMDIAFSGRPPFDVKYQQQCKPTHGTKSSQRHEMHVPLSSAQIKMETAQAGTCEYRFTELGDYNYNHNSQRHQTLIVQQKIHSKPSASFSSPGKVYSFCQGEETVDDSETVPLTLQGKPPFAVDLDIRPQGQQQSRPQNFPVTNIGTHSYNVRIPHHLLQLGNSFITIRRVRDANGCERLLDVSAASPRVQIAVHDRPSVVPLTPSTPDTAHVCVGDRLGFSLSGASPFSVFYTFNHTPRKASVTGSTFRRLAESAGNFTITSVQDSASVCRTGTSITRIIHDIPRVRVGKGKDQRVDIHAGGEAEIVFEFVGDPPFEFTYTRSENSRAGKPNRKGQILETRTERSETHVKRIKVTEEGTYDVVAIRDRWCAFAREGSEGILGSSGSLPQLENGRGQNLLTY